MKISTVREFRDNATTLLKSSEPILVTRRGKMAGIFFPSEGESLPVDLRKLLFEKLSAEIASELKAKGVTEEDVASDFKDWQRKKRAARSRR